MKGPIEHLESRIEEMNATIQHIVQTNLDEDERDSFFNMHKQRDIKAIESEISGYKRAIRILKQDTGPEVFED